MIILKKTWNAFTTIVSIIALALFVAIVVIPLFVGGSYRIVATGSMEPSISPGDIVVMKAPTPEEVQPGEVITFLPYADRDVTLTHRVTEYNEEDDTYTTRGDANGSDDSPVQYKQIRGIVMYTVPYVGLIVSPLRNLLIGTAGTNIIAIVGAGIVLYGLWIIISSIFTKNKPQDTTQDETEKDADTCSEEKQVS